MSHWSEPYVGIPHKSLGRGLKGCDCYGLVYLVYKREKHIELDSYDKAYMSTTEQEQISALISNAAVSPLWELIIDYKPMDVLAFRTGPLITHVGLVIDKRHMLHSTAKNGQSVIEDYTKAEWHSRYVGTYRYVG